MNTMWSLELRNGFGLDVELSNSRPCFIVKGFDDDGEPITVSSSVSQDLALIYSFLV
jgi:hypothetical protein